ncbi:MAG: ATP-binding protein [candidate division Zixibacteria bacterium]
MIKLRRLDGTEKDRWLKPGKFLVGRNQHCDIRIADASISREHAYLEADDRSRVFLTDLESSNGTTVNGHRVFTKVLLRVGDEITFGDIRFRLRQEAEEADLSTSITVLDTEDPLGDATMVAFADAQVLQDQDILNNPQTFKALSALGKLPVQVDDMDQLLTKALKLLAEAIVADRIAMLELTGDAHLVKVKATSLPKAGGSSEFVVSKTIINEVLKGEVAVLIPEIKTDTRFTDRTSVPGSDIKSVLVVPVMDQDQIIGLLYADTYDTGISFTVSHLRIFTTFGDILGAKVANHDLIKGRQEKAVLEAELQITEQKKVDLERKNNELRQTQAKLIASEKAASLKHLVAGIAHEMNNPLGALLASISTMNRAVDFVEPVLQDSSLDILKEKYPKFAVALDSFRNGTSTGKVSVERISKVIEALKQFSHLDQSEISSIDLHARIDATLVLLAQRLKDSIVVKREFGSIPQLECHPDEISQVFMNLLLNAIAAVKDEGVITISTEAVESDEKIKITVSDDGQGIPTDKMEKIFEAGFGGWEVGVGVGLGLPIVQSILAAHKATITPSNNTDGGATFTIIIPVRYQPEKTQD